MQKIILLLTLLFFSVASLGNNTQTTERYFHSIKNNPESLLVFLKAMPKGGILHSHLTGSVYAEDMIELGAQKHLCINSARESLLKTADCPPELQLARLDKHPALYNALIDGWSMRDFDFANQSGHDHFFAAFEKFHAAHQGENGKILADILQRLYTQHVSYVEFMANPDEFSANHIGYKLQWKNNFPAMQAALEKKGIDTIVTDADLKFNQMVAQKDTVMHCGTSMENPACDIKVNFLYQVIRSQNNADFFATLVEGFLLAEKNPQVVGITVAGEEDNPIALKNYTEQMKMVAYLRKKYPSVRVTLHAGELKPGMVTDKNLSFHIRQAIEIANTDRIGQGVDVASEKNARSLLQEMARKKIPVEVNLTSNADILGVKGKQQPLPLYLANHVPVVISTDDAGVLRTDISREYLHAVTTYHLSYLQVKQLVRNSLTYSFLPGKSLWQNAEKAIPVAACAKDKLGAEVVDKLCQEFLSKDQKAQMQWQLEGQFASFESGFALK